MIKLTPPIITCTDIFAACLKSVPSDETGIEYVKKLNKVKARANTEWLTFNTRAAAVDLHLFGAAKYGKKDQKIIDEVTKDDFVRLYTEYMVKGDADARDVYDIIRASAKGPCPLCGIATVTTVDHYLPKARYPIFSIYKQNLVPACDTCNKGKGSSVYKSRESQPLHPYYSAHHFYSTNWIKANLIKTTPLTFSFEVDPPQGWTASDIERITNHFDDFDLDTKYSTNATQMLTLIKGIITDELNLSQNPANVKTILLRYSSQQKPNTTLRVIMLAMANDEEVCSGMYL